MATAFQRTFFETPRAAEFLTTDGLRKRTGHTAEWFAVVALKELVDNALDACEQAGVTPHISIEVAERASLLTITVADNGDGLRPEVVERILNFDALASDKSAYIAPTRGAQGNALKTILGMPHALGLCVPVVIEACGVRHAIRIWLDPADVLQQEHRTTSITPDQGTRITVPFPIRQAEQLQARRWARAYALLNPHALIQFHATVENSEQGESDEADDEEFYQPAENQEETHQPTVVFPAPKGWRKFLPTDFTAPHWYTRDDLTKLIFLHINQDRAMGTHRTLRNFVRETFRGLTGSAKASTVCRQVPAIRSLHDFETHPQVLPVLHAALCEYGEDPSPKILGSIGRDHIAACFAAWYGVKRSWYEKVDGKVQGMPFFFEVGIAETEQAGEVVYGLNFSRSFHDPLRGAGLDAGAVRSFGVESFLANAHVFDAPHTAVLVHLVCPRLPFLDYGKSSIAHLPYEMRKALAQALWLAAKMLYKEEEQRRKDAVRAERRKAQRTRACQREVQASVSTIKDAVFAVIPEAYQSQTQGGRLPVFNRDLFYVVHDLVQPLTSNELQWKYFEDLVVEYQRLHGALPMLRYKPRGELIEPHTERRVQLGTREVDDFSFPDFTYDKILYIEKSGVAEALVAENLHRRYDLAIIAAEGYATEAIRTLLSRASTTRACRVFVWHDADPYGYDIARTLREATRRMPDYRVDVVDFGLMINEALDLGLRIETKATKRQPPDLPYSDLERRTFNIHRHGKKQWLYNRIELNALPVPDRVPFLERKLHEAGATAKVLPPADVLQKELVATRRVALGQRVDQVIADLVAAGRLRQTVLEVLHDQVPACDLVAGLADDPLQSWREIAARDGRGLSDADREIIDRLVQEHLAQVGHQGKRCA